MNTPFATSRKKLESHNVPDGKVSDIKEAIQLSTEQTIASRMSFTIIGGAPEDYAGLVVAVIRGVREGWANVKVIFVFVVVVVIVIVVIVVVI